MSLLNNENTTAQNLVLNPGFENLIQCPYSPDALNFCIGWATINSSDCFNKCATLYSFVSVPSNFVGNQYPHNSNGYSGLITYALPDTLEYREYAQSKLLKKLGNNSTYCVSFYVSAADSVRFQTDKMGVHFSPNPIDPVVYPIPTPPYLIFYQPQVESTLGVLSDTANWVEIAGTYTANGTEEYITIGNFYKSPNTTVIYLDSTNANYFAYYYIDDVSVEEIKTVDAGLDKSICINDSVTLGNNSTENAQYQWYPQSGLSNAQSANPKASPLQTTTYVVSKTQCKITTTDSVTVYVSNNCSAGTYSIPSVLYQHDLFFINGLEPNTQVELYTLLGQKIISIEDYRNSISTANLAQGTYIYKVSKPNGEIVTGKVMVVK